MTNNMFAARRVRRALALVLLAGSAMFAVGTTTSSPAYAWNPADDGWHRCLIDGKWMWCKDF
ncbi:hypothetical protein [Nonomuraea sediminis]|uniref:hypothetical protein n=1 Tax=Nonomuraea sediminis TaxID=2835864 RepID=UPI001BDD5B5C|nr:hypothetical protein [Nonomuraea sediminis]